MGTEPDQDTGMTARDFTQRLMMLDQKRRIISAKRIEVLNLVEDTLYQLLKEVQRLGIRVAELERRLGEQEGGAPHPDDGGD